MKSIILFFTTILFTIASKAQSGTIVWPTACPVNGCATAYTDANGVQVNVISTYGTGTGAPVNLTTIQGTNAGALGINISSSAAATTPGLGITLDYGTNYNDALTGNLVKITFSKAIQGAGFSLFDLTSTTLCCSSYGFNGSAYNDMVVITGIGTNGDTVQATLTELARGAYNSASNPTYVPGSPSYIVADQISITGNQAYITGGYVNSGGLVNNQTTNPGTYITSADVTVTFPVPIKEIRVLYKNYSASSGDYFSYYKTSGACPAAITTGNFSQGNLNPQTIMVGNINYTGIVVSLSGAVTDDPDGVANGVSGTPMGGAIVTLYAADGVTVIATDTTDASGNYTFYAVTNTSYVIRVTPPAGYSNVSSTDGTPANGLTAVTVGSAAVPGINFGLNQPPVAGNNLLNNQTPGSPATVPNVLGNDTDPNGGTLSPDSISLIAPSGATGVVTDAQGDVTGFTIPGQGTWVLNSSTGAVTFTPQAGFTGDPTPITYTVADAAGLASPPASITIDYNPPVTVSGTVYNDNNAGTPGGTPIPAGTAVTLYAADGITVIAATTTDAGGSYSFPGLVPGNYVVGVAAPAGFQHVSSTDGTPRNGLTVITIGGVNVPGIDFGLNQPPVATGDNMPNQIAGQPMTIPNLLANDSDPNNGTLSPDSISLIAPPGAGNFTVDLQGDTTGFTVPGEGTWSLNSTTGSLTFAPDPGFNGTPTPVSYVVTDGAGLNGTATNIGFVLPVTWLDFDARLSGSDVLLSWQTERQWNSDRFEIEYSAYGSLFNPAGTVKSSGNTSTPSRYSFIHKDVAGLNTAVLFYRLRQVDIDGACYYSKVAQVKPKHASAGILVYPNPVGSGTALNIVADNLKEIQVYDISGRRVKSAQYKEGTRKATLATGKFASGVYWIKVNTSDAVKLIVK